jgi:hypothetical protein
MNNISLTDVTIHVDENLAAEQRQEIEAGLRAIDGVVSVHNADARPHLLLVEYNPAQTNSGSLLASVTGQGYHAELIGL